MNSVKEFSDIVEAMGLQVVSIRVIDGDGNVFDLGLRRQLDKSYAYAKNVQQMLTYMETETLYIVKDTFEEFYISLRLTENLTTDGAAFLHIGPYIVDDPARMIGRVAKKLQLDELACRELYELYCTVPRLEYPDAMENVLICAAGYLFSRPGGIRVNRISQLYESGLTPRKLTDEDDRISMTLLAERYRLEDEMMAAIEAGNLEKAIHIGRMFSTENKFSMTYSEFRMSKNNMHSFNTLCRKAVQRAAVHPMHIEQISVPFDERIEKAFTGQELHELGLEMMRKYCLLVRDHSLKGYSSIVQEAINFIDFNLRDELSLTSIANHVAVNPSYLSGKFKKETGKKLTEYVNVKRIHEALPLLAATDHPIQQVSEQVGIYDESYFSRLFKMIQGSSPKQYRMLMRGK